MSLEKQIDLISAAGLNCFLDRLPEWFVSLFLETGKPDCPQCMKFSVKFGKGLLCFRQSDKDRSLDTDLLTACLLSNSLSFTLNPDSTSEPPAKLLKDHTSLGWCFASGYGTGVLMEVGRGVEDRILKHHPLSWSGRERAYWLMLLGLKEERSKCYLELCKCAPCIMCTHHTAKHITGLWMHILG